MDDLRLGAAIRRVRHRRGWTQSQLAARARVSSSLVSSVERGHVDSVALGTLRRIAGALDIRDDLTARWRAGDLDRLLNARHAELHESVAREFVSRFPSWTLAPEVSFSIFGERGVIDVLGWHARTGAVLVIELKTDIVDVNELLGTADRKRRLAAAIARERGWTPRGPASLWVVVAEGRTNRRRLDDHRAVFRNALPADGRAMRTWLKAPAEPIAGISSWSDVSGAHARRVRPRPLPSVP